MTALLKSRLLTVKQSNTKPGEGRPPVITVDLDGTLAEVGGGALAEREPREGAADAIAKIRSAGIWVVVWTANEEGEDSVRSWLDANGIEYDEINSNRWDDGGTRKIRSDAYLDDKAIATAGKDWDELTQEAILEVLGKARQPIGKHDGYDELRELAEGAYQELEQLLSNLGFPIVRIEDMELGQFEEEVRKPGGVVLIAPPKGEARATEKVESDYHGNWRKLLDMVRAAVAVDTQAEIGPAMDKLKDAGAVLAKPPKDRFAAPLSNGYRDILANYKLPSGVICEVQFHLKPMLIARERERLAYDVARAIKASIEEEGNSRPMTPAEAEACRRAKDESRHIFARAWEECQAKEKPPELVNRLKVFQKNVDAGRVNQRLFKAGEELAAHTDPAPMPGYGQIFVNDSDVGGHKSEIWYVGGDGDEDGFGDVVESVIREAFPGVSKITREAEGFPPRNEGWKQVYPKEQDWVKDETAPDFYSKDVEKSESIAESGRQAEMAVAAHRAGYRQALNRLPDGAKIGKWTKVTTGGSVFWTGGKLGGGVFDVLVEVGQAKVDAALRANGIEVPKSLEKGPILDTVQAAGKFLAQKWAALEARYGRKTALTMAVAMIASMPIPGNIPAVIAAAEAVRGIRGFFDKEFEGEIGLVLGSVEYKQGSWLCQ